MFDHNHLVVGSAPPQGRSPLRERAEARADMRAAIVRTGAVVAAETRLGVTLAELVEHGVDITLLDLPALAEAGQRIRRARAM